MVFKLTLTKLLGLDRAVSEHDNEPLPVQVQVQVQVIVNVKDARKADK